MSDIVGLVRKHIKYLITYILNNLNSIVSLTFSIMIKTHHKIYIPCERYNRVSERFFILFSLSDTSCMSFFHKKTSLIFGIDHLGKEEL